MKHVLKLWLPLILLTTLFIACGSGGGKLKDLGKGGVSYGTLTGIVKDTNGNVVGDASITVTGKTFKTNAQGYFAFEEITESDDAIVIVHKDGYIKKAEHSTIKRGLNDHITITLSAYGQSTTVNATQPILVRQGAASISIPANALVNAQGVAVTGMVIVNLTPFDPTDESDVQAFPGDFVGVRQNGDTGPLQSFGFMDITVTDLNGSQLSLASGQNAQIAIPIPDSLRDSAQPTIPLWRFNTQNGQWEEEGTLTRNGNVYQSPINQFATWNADVLYQSAYVTGRLMNCETNTTITCGRIVVKDSQNRGWESEERCTQDDGTFKLAVMPNTQATLFGTKNGATSKPYTFQTPLADKTHDIGKVCVKNPKIRITLTWGENPRDLDSHITFEGEDQREMVYYSRKSSSFGQVQLDTDDTSSFGPEITTVTTLNDGIYRYSVHHYSGSGTISDSKAVLNMVIDKEGNGNTEIYRMEPTAGALGSGDVWLAWDVSVVNGDIASITELGGYLNGIHAADTKSFSDVNATIDTNATVQK